MKTLKILALSAAVLCAATAVHADDHDGKRQGGRLAKIDTNNDGKISRAEHLAAAEARFKRMDKDGDGFITREEGKAARAHMKEKVKDVKEKRDERRERRGVETDAE